MSPRPPIPGRIPLFAAMWAGYLAVNAVVRWMRWPLFHGHGVYGWEAPTRATTAVQIASVSLPYALCALAAAVALRAAPRALRGWFVPLAAWAVVAVLELDLAWFGLSQSHIGPGEVVAFLTEDWRQDFGVQPADLARMGILLGAHAAVAATAWITAAAAGPRLRPRFPRPRTALLVAAALFCADSALVGWHRAHAVGESQWTDLARRNALRVALLDPLWHRCFGRARDFAAAESTLADLPADGEPTEPRAAVAAPPPRERHHVVLLVAESWNPSYVDDGTMPFFTELGRGGLRLDRHYSTGNCTHFGFLGLLYGQPVTFYGHGEGHRSPWIDRFRDRGYRIRFLGFDVHGFRYMGDYLGNVPDPAVAMEDWQMVDAMADTLGGGGCELLVVFYQDTHYPYAHPPEFTRFRPEVPADFDFSSWDVQRHQDAIRNRYRNCLFELDAWLQAAVAKIDLARSLVVITGDHGQEFFENGRLAHSSALSEAQIRVPMVILGDGVPAAAIASPTSHVDVMATLADLLGWDDPPIDGGRSVFAPARRTVLVAHNNFNTAARSWAAIGPSGKVVAEIGDGGARVVDLLDLDDRRQPFGNGIGWRDPLLALRWLQRVRGP